MTARERRLIGLAELAAMGPEDASRLLARVTSELRSMVRHGRAAEADRLMAAMLPGTARLVALAALGELDRDPAEQSRAVANLLARREADYESLRRRERVAEADVLARAREIREEAEQEAAERQSARRNVQRDQVFLRRLRERRSKRGPGEAA